MLVDIKLKIRENITPRGDGNFYIDNGGNISSCIRENITPRGDGNMSSIFFITL